MLQKGSGASIFHCAAANWKDEFLAIVVRRNIHSQNDLDQQLRPKQSRKISSAGACAASSTARTCDSRVPPRGARRARSRARASKPVWEEAQWRSRMDLKREPVGAPAPAASHSLDPISAARPRCSKPSWRAPAPFCGRQRRRQVERRRRQPRGARPRNERVAQRRRRLVSRRQLHLHRLPRLDRISVRGRPRPHRLRCGRRRLRGRCQAGPGAADHPQAARGSRHPPLPLPQQDR